MNQRPRLPALAVAAGADGAAAGAAAATVGVERATPLSTEPVGAAAAERPANPLHELLESPEEAYACRGWETIHTVPGL